jgi:hypothetical protein
MYPEGVCKDGQQQGNRNEFAAAPAPAPEAPTPGFAIRFVAGFARKRPIRAVLLATAMCAISYSLARHHDHAPLPAPSGPAQVTQQQVAQQQGTPASEATTGSSATASGDASDSSSNAWHPPIGVDRSQESLDRLTFDLASAPQTLYPASGFQAEHVSLPADAKQPEQPADVTAQPSLAQPLPVQEAPGVGIPDQHETSTASVPAASQPVPVLPHSVKAWRDEIDQYLWSVYQRSATKRDGSGDFTWKDEAAAARLGLVTRQYVIGGMDSDFRELLYNLGHAMDADGIHWTILSGFRDDYRQSLASGYKAHVGNSFHGGSRATGGYGHGCAADIEASNSEGGSNNAVWRWVDQHGEKFGVYRPMKQIDPAHIQPFGAWHDVALNLRSKEAENAFLPASIDSTEAEKPPVTSLVETRSGVSESQFDCVRSHRSHFRLAGLSHHPVFPGSHMHRALLFHGGRMHRFGRRRMIVIVSGPEKHASAETGVVADQTGETAKAEASNTNRHDARQHKVADAGHPDKRQSNLGKEAAQSGDRAQRTRAQEAKGHHEAKDPTKAQKVADSKHQQKHTADASMRQAKANEAKSGEAKSGQSKTSESKASQAKASQAKTKSHVAAHQDAASTKKL